MASTDTALVPHLCPVCRSDRILDIDVRWRAQSLDPTDANNVGLLDEWQCEHCGLSFWIPAEEEER